MWMQRINRAIEKLKFNPVNCLLVVVLISAIQFSVMIDTAAFQQYLNYGLVRLLKYNVTVSFFTFPVLIDSGTALLLMSAEIAFWLLVTNFISVGAVSLKKTNSREGAKPGWKLIFSGYTSGNTANIFKAMALQTLEIVLFSLLLLIPGLYRALQLYMVPYLMATSPELSYSEAKQKSIAMTHGVKFSMFMFILVLMLVELGINWVLARLPLTLVTVTAFSFLIEYLQRGAMAQLYLERGVSLTQ